MAKITLFPGEQMIVETHEHVIAYLGAIVQAVVVLILIILGAIFIPAKVGAYDVGSIAHLLLLLLFAADIIYILGKYVSWRSVEYALTTHRVMFTSGVFSRSSEAIGLDRIQNIAVHQSLSERMVNAGDIEIESAGRDGTEIMHLVPDPQGFLSAVMQAGEQLASGQSRSPVQQKPPLFPTGGQGNASSSGL